MDRISPITYFWLKVVALFLILLTYYSTVTRAIVSINDGFVVLAVFSSLFVNIMIFTGSVANMYNSFIALIVGIVQFAGLLIMSGFVSMGAAMSVAGTKPTTLQSHFLHVSIFVPLIGMLWVLYLRNYEIR